MVIMIPVLVGVILLAAAGWTAWRRMQQPPELRGDWWSEFEHQFRAYAAHHDGAPRPRGIRNRPR